VVAEQQRSVARELAAAGDLVAALPFRLPQAAWGVLAMLALSALLFVVRYSLQDALSLERPLSSMLAQVLLGSDQGSESGALEPEPARPKPGDEESAPPLNEEGETRDPDSRPASPEPAEGPDAFPAPLDQMSVEIPEVDGLSVEEPYGDEMDYNSLAEGERQGEQEGQNGENPSDQGKPSDQNAEQASQDSKSDPWNKETDSLLDRLKEAFQNMLAKMNMEPPKGQGQQSEAESNSNAESTGEKAEASEGSAQGGASESGEAQMEGGESGQPSSQQIAQGESGNSAEQPGEGQPASAAGGNDGSKDAAELAEIEEAMGRLEELYSRRAEEIKGEVMVETETARQTARTPQQPKAAGHEYLGGTVSRDAIPLAYQAYIKSYFENLRTKN
jgi:hypothetical protein